MEKSYLPKQNSGQLLARWQIFSQAIKDLLFPITCLNCGADDMLICSVCLNKIKVRNFNDSWEQLVCSDYLDRVFIATWYEDQLVQEMIKRGKYQGEREYFEILAWLLYKFWQDNFLADSFIEPPVVVPLPLHRRRLYERGYNQSQLLAAGFADLAGLLAPPDLLQRIRYTKHQTNLNQARRQKNIDRAFQVTTAAVPRQVLLIDDVVTTGASLNEAARVLKKAGGQKVCALVIAKN